MLDEQLANKINMQKLSLLMILTVSFVFTLTITVSAQKDMSPIGQRLQSITLQTETARYLADAGYDGYELDQNNVLQPTNGYKLFLRKDGSATLAVSVENMSKAVSIGKFLQFFCEGCVEKTCEFVKREENSDSHKEMIRYDCVRCHKKDGTIQYCRGGFHIGKGGIIE